MPVLAEAATGVNIRHEKLRIPRVTRQFLIFSLNPAGSARRSEDVEESLWLQQILPAGGREVRVQDRN